MIHDRPTPFRFAIPLGLLIVCLVMPAWADFETGMDAYNRQVYATALREWQPLAEQGQAEAQSNLGALYDEGLGVPQDYVKARQWYERAATQGYAPAQFNLGQLYANGQGVPQDYGKARQWFEKAAVQGRAEAQYNLGELYVNGQGVPQDYGKARQWFEKAAVQGRAEAQHNLGELYAKGHGVPQDYVQARQWWEKAAAQGLMNSWVNLGWLYENGHGVPQDYVQARLWYEKAANLGNAVAQLNLALLYANGQGVPQDYVQAHLWYEKAASQGNVDAQNALAQLYVKGQGVPQDYVKARQWVERAAAQGDADAQYNLGWLNAAGRGMSQDIIQDQNRSISEIAESVGDSVAMIITYDVTGSAIAQGSGVFITKTGTLLTNAHVVNDAYSAEVISSFGTFDKVRILTQDSKRDLALISIPTDNSFPASIAKNTNFKPGDRVIAIGNPLGLEKTISDGLISGIRHKDDGVELIQTTVPISHGSSGGVLLNTSGELIGITTSSFESGQNINFAISLNTISDFVKRYKSDDPQGVKFQDLRPAKESVWYRIILKWIGYIVLWGFALVFGSWSGFGWALPLIFLAFYLLYLVFKGLHWLITYPFRKLRQNPQTLSSDGNDKLG